MLGEVSYNECGIAELFWKDSPVAMICKQLWGQPMRLPWIRIIYIKSSPPGTCKYNNCPNQKKKTDCKPCFLAGLVPLYKEFIPQFSRQRETRPNATASVIKLWELKISRVSLSCRAKPTFLVLWSSQESPTLPLLIHYPSEPNVVSGSSKLCSLVTFRVMRLGEAQLLHAVMIFVAYSEVINRASYLMLSPPIAFQAAFWLLEVPVETLNVDVSTTARTCRIID